MDFVRCLQHQKGKQFRAGAVACVSLDHLHPERTEGSWHSMAAHREHSKTHWCSETTIAQARSSSLELEGPSTGVLKGDAEIQDPTYCKPSSLQCCSPKLLLRVFHTKIHLPALKKPQRCRPGAHKLEIQQNPATARNRIPAAAPAGAGLAPGADGCSAKVGDSKEQQPQAFGIILTQQQAGDSSQCIF